MRHAYTKNQLKDMGFNGWEYKFINDDDVGDYFAKLDMKSWGVHCMFLYLTTSYGDKIFIPVFRSNNYFGFMDIPIGAVVDLSIDCYIGADRAFLREAHWVEGATDPKEAEETFYRTGSVGNYNG